MDQEDYLFILEKFYFSPDSKNVAYIVGVNAGVVMILNEKKQTRILVSVVINKKYGKAEAFNQILEPPEGNLFWKNNNSLSYIAVKRVEDFIHIYRVEDQINDI